MPVAVAPVHKTHHAAVSTILRAFPLAAGSRSPFPKGELWGDSRRSRPGHRSDFRSSFRRGSRCEVRQEGSASAELGLADFDLPMEVCRLISLLDELKDGTIQRLEVRAGIPHHLVFETRVSTVLVTRFGAR